MQPNIGKDKSSIVMSSIVSLNAAGLHYAGALVPMQCSIVPRPFRREGWPLHGEAELGSPGCPIVSSRPTSLVHFCGVIRGFQVRHDAMDRHLPKPTSYMTRI